MSQSSGINNLGGKPMEVFTQVLIHSKNDSTRLYLFSLILGGRQGMNMLDFLGLYNPPYMDAGLSFRYGLLLNSPPGKESPE